MAAAQKLADLGQQTEVDKDTTADDILLPIGIEENWSWKNEDKASVPSNKRHLTAKATVLSRIEVT